jgi:glycosyltransferase involved in cell wall biosynthesis
VAPQGEASRILLAEEAGLWIPSGDPAALAAAVRRLATDEALRHRLAAASLAAAPRHTRERQAELFIAALEKVVAGRGGEIGRSAQ